MKTTLINRRFSLYFLLVSVLLGLAQGGSAAARDGGTKDAVRDVVMALETTWNSGDMSGYLALYQADESLSITFGNTVIQGWAAADRIFRESYPDPVRMGRFSIDRLEITSVGPDTAFAYGNFTHEFPGEIIKGGFSHVVTRDVAGAWIIRHERTSRGEVIDKE